MSGFQNCEILRSWSKLTPTILDGEIVALDKQGLPCFEGLQHRKQNLAIVFYCFDVLYIDSFDLTQCPLIVRKRALKKILPRNNTGRIRFTDHISGKGEPLFAKLEALNLEGMVVKRKDSVYSSMRCRDWFEGEDHRGARNHPKTNTIAKIKSPSGRSSGVRAATPFYFVALRD